jgi:hypothetical protein
VNDTTRPRPRSDSSPAPNGVERAAQLDAVLGNR